MQNLDLFGNQILPPLGKPITRNKSGGHLSNPLVKSFGKGPEGQKCKGCKFLYYKERTKRYYKCELRGEPKASAVNDHKIGWNACAKFEKEIIW